jgi:hypothetical protein
VSHPPITPLASAQVDNDQLAVGLVELDGMPAIIRITWPLRPTIVDPNRFPDTAAVLVRLFAEASPALAGIKAIRRL